MQFWVFIISRTRDFPGLSSSGNISRARRLAGRISRARRPAGRGFQIGPQTDFFMYVLNDVRISAGFVIWKSLGVGVRKEDFQQWMRESPDGDCDDLFDDTAGGCQDFDLLILLTTGQLLSLLTYVLTATAITSIRHNISTRCHQ